MASGVVDRDRWLFGACGRAGPWRVKGHSAEKPTRGWWLRKRLAFTYVGNLPRGFAFKNSRYVPPLDGEALAAELRAHHVYITGSQNEPGGNHQNEGALCGLPLIYRTSGCLPEYCHGFGVPFSGPADLMETVDRMIREYPHWVAEMPRYHWTAERMTREWIALFESLLHERAAIVAHRRLWRNPLTVLANQVAI